MKRIIFGVFLVVLGGLLVAERAGGVHLAPGLLWPLIMFALAASAFADYRIRSGVVFTLLGSIFLVCSLGLFGLSYGRSWPLLMIAVGIGIVLRALFPDVPRRIRDGEVHRV